jgi:hypothetical protein
LRNRRVPVRFYDSQADAPDQKLLVITIGWDRKLRNYWLQRLYGNDFSLKKRMLLPPGRIDSLLSDRASDADLAIVDLPEPLKEISVGNAYLLPHWMEFVIDLEEAFIKLRIKEILRRIRKYAIEYEFRYQKKDLDFFYHKMYRPLIMKNHGHAAELAKYDYFYSRFSKKKLVMMFLKSNGETVAGSVLERGEGFNRILAFGVVDGNMEIVRTGVHAAAYYFTMQMVRDEGGKQLLCGSAMPVPLDGVTQFKLRMGAKPYRKDLKGRRKYHVVLLNHSPGVSSAMKNNPLFHLSGEDLRIAAFMDPDDFKQPKEFNQYLKLISTEHVDGITCYILSNREKIEQWIKDGEVPPVELVVYEKVNG